MAKKGVSFLPSSLGPHQVTLLVAVVLLAALVWQVRDRWQCEDTNLKENQVCEATKTWLIQRIHQNNYTTSTRRVLVFGQSGIGKSSLIRGLLLYMEPNREDHRMPKVVGSKQPGTMETTEYFGGRVDFDTNTLETFSFFDTRGLYDAYADANVSKTVEGILSRELSKIDVALFCINKDRSSPGVRAFMSAVLKPIMADKRVALGVVGTHLGTLTEGEEGAFKTEVRHDFLTATDMDNPPMILAKGWSDTSHAYSRESMQNVLKAIGLLSVKRSL